MWLVLRFFEHPTCGYVLMEIQDSTILEESVHFQMFW